LAARVTVVQRAEQSAPHQDSDIAGELGHVLTDDGGYRRSLLKAADERGASHAHDGPNAWIHEGAHRHR
jgi:hypothetical protein